MILGNPIMIGGGGAGDSSLAKAYAIILAEYPAGSTCICSNGAKTYVAGNTYGAWAFGVPSGGTWVVDCFNGTDYESSVSKARKIIEDVTQHSTHSIVLDYNLMLFDYENGGVVNDDITGGFKILKSSGSAVNIGDDAITFRNTDTSSYVMKILSNKSFSLVPYAAVGFLYNRTGTGDVYFGATTNGTDRTAKLPINVLSKAPEPEDTIIRCPLNSSAAHFIAMFGNTTPFNVTVKKIWLEYNL